MATGHPAASAGRIERTYLALTLLQTLASSLIWGINTLFLLDAGLSNTQAFTANAFFTVGLLLFEIPTGVVADTTGRRRSFLLGTLSLLASTLGYWAMWAVQGPFLGWALTSILLGLGFAFFSGATEAWLVDALDAASSSRRLDDVFGRGQTVMGVAMLGGSVLGGWVAQVTNLGVPYLLRAGLLLATFLLALRAMHDQGFTPRQAGRLGEEVRAIATTSVREGLGRRPVRWIMLAGVFSFGVQIYAFYALQPHLLDLWGSDEAYGIAGIAAATIAAAQIVGGLSVPGLRRLVRRRTDAMVASAVLGSVGLVVIGRTSSFWVALAVFAATSLVGSAARPMRQAFLNAEIPSQQRATILSFDSLMGSLGGSVAQPALGRVADAQGYGASLVVGGAIEVLAIPLLLLARRERADGDPVEARATSA